MNKTVAAQRQPSKLPSFNWCTWLVWPRTPRAHVPSVLSELLEDEYNVCFNRFFFILSFHQLSHRGLESRTRNQNGICCSTNTLRSFCGMVYGAQDMGEFPFIHWHQWYSWKRSSIAPRNSLSSVLECQEHQWQTITESAGIRLGDARRSKERI